MLKHFYCFLFLCLPIFNGFSQDSLQAPFQLSYKLGGGFMITHSPIMEYVSEQHFVKHELNLEKRLQGEKAWHSRYGYPIAGASMSYFHFSKDQFFGKGISLSPYYSFYLLEKKRINLKLRTTVGLGFIESTFDLEENYKNVAIGSQFNLFFGALLELEWKPFDRWGIRLGANYSHFSNTGYQAPNLGINLPSLDLGLVYQLRESQEFKAQTKSTEEVSGSSPQLQIRWANGINEVYPVNGEKYVVSALSIEWEKVINLKSNAGLGLDLYYNPAQRVKLASDSIYIKSGWENLQMGISAHHLFKFGKFGAGLKLGYYLKKEDEDLTSTYQEVYGQHVITKRLNGFISLKTHLSKAEYLLIGLRYRIK